MKPITPEEASKKKLADIPDAVIEAFNTLIIKNFNGTSSTVKQDDVMALLTKDETLTRRQIYDNNWLDVEDLYRAVGWKVEYDKPGYNESYPATFKFTRK